MVDLSVVIITLNNKDILEACIASVKEHTKRISYEIIVTDNGSTDGTADMLRSRYPDVCIIENRKNLGFSAANNKGLKNANGRYCLVLNDDTYIDEDAFSKLAEYMDKHENVAAAGPKLMNIDGTIQKQGSFLTAGKWSSKVPVEVDFLIGACLMIRTSVLDEVGYFDENLFFYNDDLDLCKRIKNKGFKIVYVPDSSVYHYGGFSSKKAGNRALEIEGIRGGLYFCRKHYGPVAYQIYRAFIIIASLMMSILPFDRAYYLKVSAMAFRQELLPKY